MERNAQRTSQNAAQTYDHVQGGLSQSQAPTSTTQNRFVESMLPPSRNTHCRTSFNQNYDTMPSIVNYPSPQLHSSQIHSSNSMQGVETQYQPYLHEGQRATHFGQPPQYNPFSTYPAGHVSTPGQQTVMFDTMGQLQVRQPNILASMNSHYPLPLYGTPHDQAGICMSETTANVIASQTDQANYGPLPMIRTDTQMQRQPNLTPEGPVSSFQHYEQLLKTAFNFIILGSLKEASHKLLVASRWLLTSVPQLGLHFDSETQYHDRLAMWREFNHCWEALAQKQRRMLEQEKHSRESLPEKLGSDEITFLVDELVSLCDEIETYGLVDYEMGVWEEQIVSAFMSCLDMVENDERVSRRLSN